MKRNLILLGLLLAIAFVGFTMVTYKQRAKDWSQTPGAVITNPKSGTPLTMAPIGPQPSVVVTLPRAATNATPKTN